MGLSLGWLGFEVYAGFSGACGGGGTLLAFGAVREPLAGVARAKTLGYLDAVSRFLGNPVQASTKAFLDGGEAGRVVSAAGGRLSVLVTIVSLRYHGVLEP